METTPKSLEMSFKINKTTLKPLERNYKQKMEAISTFIWGKTTIQTQIITTHLPFHAPHPRPAKLPWRSKFIIGISGKSID